MAKFYYTLVQIAPNQAIDDRLSIGLIAFDEESIKVKFSVRQQENAKRILTEGRSIVDAIVTNIKENLAHNPQILQEKVSTKGSFQNDWIASYMDYLHRYSNGTLRFSEPKLVLNSLTESSFNDLFNTFFSLTVFQENNIISTSKKILPFIKTEKESNPQNNLASYEDDFTYEGHILDQLYYSLKRFEEIPVLPSFFLRNLFPFQSKNDNEYVYTSGFTLVIKHQKLEYFFENIKISEEGQVIYTKDDTTKALEDYQEKLDFVIQKLNYFLIFYIEINNTRKFIRISEEDSDCTLYSYRKLNFNKSLEKLSKINLKDDLDALNNAYTHFLFGNYHIAYKLYEELAEKSKNKKKYILYFICQYNIKKLGRHISGLWQDFEKNRALSKEIDKKIDLDKIQNKLDISKKEYEVLSLIKDEDFLHYIFYRITSVSRDIIKDYYTSIRGGWSSNKRVNQLRAEVAKLVSFYVGNGIIFEHFDEFKKGVSVALEGFIASNAILPNNKPKVWGGISRLEDFDSYLVSLMWIYGEPDNLIEYFKRYKVKKFEYNNWNNDFWEKVDNFLDIENNLQATLKQIEEKGNNIFFEKYRRIFRNLLVILSYMKIDKDKFEDLTIKVINFLIQEPELIKKNNYRFVNLFFYKNSKAFENKNLAKPLLRFLQFLIFEVQNGKTHEDLWLTQTLSNILQKYHSDIKFDDAKVVETITGKYYYKKVFLTYIYPIVSEEQQFRLKKDIEYELQHGKFNKELYYEAIMQKIIPYENYIDKFLETKDYIYIINIAQEFNLDLSEEKFEAISQESDFYAWLANPKAFDYQKFDVNWFKDMRMISYKLENIEYLPQIAQKLAEYLKNNRKDEFLQNIYYDYFVDDFDVDEFVEDIYKRREESGKLFAKKIDDLFKDSDI